MQLRPMHSSRFFWPDKPNVSRGAWFTMYSGPSNRESEFHVLNWNHSGRGIVLELWYPWDSDWDAGILSQVLMFALLFHILEIGRRNLRVRLRLSA